MKIRREFDDFTQNAGPLVMDKDQINIRCSTEDWIRIRNERTGQIGGHDVAVIEGPFLGVFFGDADERFTCDAHGSSCS